MVNAMKYIKKYQHQIREICESLPVKRLGIFGSVLTGSFASVSDVDILVIFDDDENIDLFDNYFELKEKLEEMFNRSVDLVIDKNFTNPYFQKSVEKTREIIYER